VTRPGSDPSPALDPPADLPASGPPASGARSTASGAFVSDRRYRFAADRSSVWAAIGSVGEYRAWWPWLRRFDADGLVAGDVWSCQIQPPMPYVLRFTVTVDRVEPASVVVATIDGDVRGTARLDLDDDTGPGDTGPGDTDPGDGVAAIGVAAGCRVRLRSTLVPANRTLQVVARAARPVARFGHAWVLDTGARQFRDRALSRRRWPPGG
jgi:uncharacterized protein YndB with AHSA1/START domain